MPLRVARLHAMRRPSTIRPPNHTVPAAILRGKARTSDRAAGMRDRFSRDAKLARVEAALFLADEPLTLRRLQQVADLSDVADARRQLDRLSQLLEADNSAFDLVEIAGGFQLRTRAVYHSWLIRLKHTGHDARLTPVSLETLTIIAYKQPITRAEVDAIRGVQSAEILRQLLEKGLIRLNGRQESLGRPQLYATTKTFLTRFGLKNLDDLPLLDRTKISSP